MPSTGEETNEADEVELPRLIPRGEIESVMNLGRQIQEIASAHGIHNVFDDGGYKELLMLRLFELHKLTREGDDAEGPDGGRYEMKTVARVASNGQRKTSLQVTTEHTLTQANIDRYRAVTLWIVAVFDQFKPEAIYEITPKALEPYFERWEKKLLAQGQTIGAAPNHINNPKIPLLHVIEHGVQVWPTTQAPGSINETEVS